MLLFKIKAIIVYTTIMQPGLLRNKNVYLSCAFTQPFNQSKLARFCEYTTAITPVQSELLLLWYKDGLTQKEIAQELNRDKSTITRPIAKLKRTKLKKQE